MNKIEVWDPIIRVCHWTTVAIVVLNTTIFDDGKIHEFLGYMVVALLCLRLIWGFIGTRYARFSNFLPSKASIRAHLFGGNAGKPATLGHNPLGAIMVFNLLAALALICLTGHLMTTDLFWGVETMEDIHEVLVNYLLLSVAAHIAGVIFESLRTRVNLVTAMVSGRKKLE
jgi:cytochrome b